MTETLIFRITVAVVFSALVVFVEWNKGKRSAVDPFMLVILIPFLMLFLFAVTNDLEFAGILTAGFAFPIFAEMLIYDTILLIFLPIIRKRYTAGFCATLWALPNFLYLSMYVIFQGAGPIFVIRLNKYVLQWLIIIWLLGFASIMIYYTVNHLIYRKSILSVSHSADEETARMWENHQLESELNKAPYKICVSPKIHTPLAIGLFKRSTYLVLPEKDYSESDLRLIMEHEMIHIIRQDSRTKFFMMTSKALFWFNPFIWSSMKKCAEDLELSCDELLMENASDEDQIQYANLILNTAGDERGFTTCLSANADALRYRLHQITKPSDKKRGFLLLGIIMFVMLFMSNSTAISCSAESVNDCILSKYNLTVSSASPDDTNSQASLTEQANNSRATDSVKEYVLESQLAYDDGNYWEKYSINDPDGLMEYIGSLEVSRIFGNYKPMDDKHLTLYFEGKNDEWIDIRIYDRWICCYKYPSEKYYENIETGGILFRRSMINSIRNEYENTYYLAKAPDWDILLSFLEPLDEE